MKRKLLAAAGALLATVAIYCAVPPPQRVSAAGFTDQATFGGTSTGSVTGATTAYAITIANLSSNLPGVVLRFIPNITSVGPTQINVSGIGFVNVLRPSSIGLVAFSGGEFQAGEPTSIEFNGTNYVLASNVDITPIGKTVEFRGSATPRGTLIEDGTCVSQTTYAALFSVIGSTYGTCSAGLFAVPDSRGTMFVALDGQGANGLAGRITSASCSTPNAVGLCGSQLATLTAALIPNLTSANPSQSITVYPDGSASLEVATTGVGGLSSGAAPAGAGGAVVANTASTWGGYSAFSAPNSISVASSGTGGAAPTHPILNPALLGRRAIKF